MRKYDDWRGSYMERKKVAHYWKDLGLIMIGIAINLIGRGIASKFQLPFWLDMVGTCVISYYSGMIGGIATGLFMLKKII